MILLPFPVELIHHETQLFSLAVRKLKMTQKREEKKKERGNTLLAVLLCWQLNHLGNSF